VSSTRWWFASTFRYCACVYPESPRPLASRLRYCTCAYPESPRPLAGAVTDTSLRSVVPPQRSTAHSVRRSAPRNLPAVDSSRPRPPSPFQSTRDSCPPPGRATERTPGREAVSSAESGNGRFVGRSLADWKGEPGRRGCAGPIRA